ncbi:defensin-like protein 2 [Pyrus ussuriensis x Pyrus communis]|uniref:Defensin-like protein 2 n=1 Tax=Pyrus ussuriensis x Pyrus communis TaxID=2448454 RepID=A0A5N5FYF9_9ROSA|nr:defensin-like protein 2 [Pyrus ussuriensis x Pyrus communis]
MERSGRLFSTVFILVLLLVAIGTGPMVAEGKTKGKPSKNVKPSKTCESPSQNYPGICRSSYCAAICKQQGLMGGKCTGFRRKCVCTKKC